MNIVSVELRRFRNHHATALEFGPSANTLLGENGQGKTNVLEAISFLCLTKSFFAKSDSVAVQQGTSGFEVSGTFQSDIGSRFAVRTSYDLASAGKLYDIDGKPPETYASVIGRFPIVVLSPENSSITFGTPVERRRFLDLVISQSSASYVEEMVEYRRVLRQRNAILSDAARKLVAAPQAEEMLEPWNESLIIRGTRLVHKRREFFSAFAPYVEQAYVALGAGSEQPVLVYQPQIGDGETPEAIAQQFRSAVAAKMRDELRVGTTLVGPQRDEIQFSLNGLPLRQHASQGQHKTFLIALKVAEFFFLKERVHEVPIFLLDDVFSELDELRAQKLLALTATLGQTFITTTAAHVFGKAAASSAKTFSIHNGALRSS
ncbi:MAG: DNA replication/repair protein RecF [Ignavibacteriales bacterium]|nr:DNA replication/repair protein RecF [Ignavibacteriales bacterium]